MSLYTENETMKLIGEQSSEVLMVDSKYSQYIEDVVTAHYKNTFPDKSFIFNIGMDFFLLGFLLGKREDRQRRKMKHPNNL